MKKQRVGRWCLIDVSAEAAPAISAVGGNDSQGVGLG